jgi:hypothetical protein
VIQRRVVPELGRLDPAAVVLLVVVPLRIAVVVEQILALLGERHHVSAPCLVEAFDGANLEQAVAFERR